MYVFGSWLFLECKVQRRDSVYGIINVIATQI